VSSALVNTPGRRVSGRVDFAVSPRPTLGVEWEFALVDAKTRDLSNEAVAVITESTKNCCVTPSK
jgi:glutamate---cysteine ligase / carboxylate-amine ligase